MSRLLEVEEGFQGGMQLWSKADAYFYRSIARLQRLWEVSLLFLPCVLIMV